MLKPPTLNDFFCGCGGIAAGFKNAGFKIAGAWDFDKYAAETYRANIGDHVKQTDITEMSAADVPKADVWTFGFPCQDLAVCGKRDLIKVRCHKCETVWRYDIDNAICPNCRNETFRAANRSGLFFEVMRLLDETETGNLPKVLLAENVKALKPYLPMIEAEYKKRGYRTYHTLYNSKYWGVPQNRERYFVAGVHESLRGDFVFPEEQHDFIPKLSSVLEKNVDEKYYIPDDKARKIISQALKKLENLGGIHAALSPSRVRACSISFCDCAFW
jgi:DNA (cytosine-5)-methyltransferase 1